MLARAGQAIYLRAVFKPHRHTAAARELHEFLDALAVTPAGDDDSFKRAARFERLFNCMQPCQSVHELFQCCAEFEHALPRPFRGRAEGQPRRAVQQQDHAVEFTFAGPPGQCQPDGMEELPPAIRQPFF